MTQLQDSREYKITSKGQVTLPAGLREKLGNPSSVQFHETKTGFEVVPVIEEKWETIFDAERDNGGKGIDGKDFLKMLQAS